MILKPLILAIDDDEPSLRLLRMELALAGFEVLTATSGQEGLQIAANRQPDAAIVDIVMPVMSGLEVLAQLKATSTIPIILLTAMGTPDDERRGLTLGADDYIMKPYTADELVVRLRAALASDLGISLGESMIRAGMIEIDFRTRVVTRNGGPVALNAVEWRLLHEIAGQRGALIRNEALLAAVWGSDYSGRLTSLRRWLTRLDAKLGDGDAGGVIERENDHGYRWAVS